MPWRHISIQKLEMTNFKRFYGRHEIDLMSDPEGGRPIVLIGGDNGRGKTSIHEAINYVLYEDDDLPGINTRPTYLRAVSDRLNRRALDEGKSDYAVALELVAVEDGAPRCIRIERQWEVDVPRRTVVQASLSVSENGRPVDFIDSSPLAYQDFLRSVLPPRIAPFFIFDGERIQDFADDNNHEQRMVEAIEDILHITVYKLLRDDLKKYVIDEIERSEVKANPTDDFFELQSDRERIERSLEEKKDQLADTERGIEDSARRQRVVEDELRRIASPHASKRDDLIEERMRINRELEDAKRDMLVGFEPLPLLLCGKLKSDLRSAVQSELEGLATPQHLDQLRSQMCELKRRVLLEPEPPPAEKVALSAEQVLFYGQRFDKVCSAIFEVTESGSGSRLHDIGDAARRGLLARLDEVDRAGSLLKDAIDRRERLTSELREVETRIQSTSDDPRVRDLIAENRVVTERVGRLDEERRGVTADIQRLEAELATRMRQIEDRMEHRRLAGRGREAIKLAQRARRTLDEFIKRLAPEKLAHLQHYMDEMYARLRKPEDPIQSIEIDPETWQVILRDSRGRPLEKRVFSAGMKEMYALSLLWALARASGRELPIVIDTPVGRLDTTNRRTLFEKYLPEAGHQVVVLCTDTEVDVEWAKRLQPHVCRQYRLDYDSASDSTVIRPGFFF